MVYFTSKTARSNSRSRIFALTKARLLCWTTWKLWVNPKEASAWKATAAIWSRQWNWGTLPLVHYLTRYKIIYPACKNNKSRLPDGTAAFKISACQLLKIVIARNEAIANYVDRTSKGWTFYPLCKLGIASYLAIKLWLFEADSSLRHNNLGVIPHKQTAFNHPGDWFYIPLQFIIHLSKMGI